LCTAVYHTQDYFTGGHPWPDIELAIPLPGQTFYADLNRRSVIEAGRVLGLSESICQREVGRMTEKAMSEMDDIIAHITQENTSAPKEVAAHQAGEMRLLRAIRHIVMSEMLEKMK
jgi:serine/threonine-protein kinase HipA